MGWWSDFLKNILGGRKKKKILYQYDSGREE